MVSKTPVAILHEVCTKLNTTLMFSVESSYGPPNDPIFEMSVETGNGLKAFGKGRKKKEAQHEAAKALLAMLGEAMLNHHPPAISPPLPVAAELNTLSLTPNSPSAASQPSSKVSENYVGLLQEMCQQKIWPLPNYIVVRQTGDFHQPTFTMRCEVGQHSAIGISSTKKQAKQEAACSLYNILRVNPIPPNQGIQQQGETKRTEYDLQLDFNFGTKCQTATPAPRMSETEKMAVIEKYSLCKPLTVIPIMKPSLKFGSYHTSMQDLLSQVRADLDGPEFNSPVKTLEEITKKLGVTTVFHEGRDISPPDSSIERCFVYAIVNTQPVTVQVGEGQTNSDATVEAARSVLKYWQLFLGIFPVQ